MAERSIIEIKKIAPSIEREARQIRRIAPEMLRQVMQHRTRGSNRRGSIFQAESIDRGHLKVIAHGEQRGFGSEDPIIVSIENPARRWRWGERTGARAER